MKVFYGNRGSEFYIMCSDFREIYVFDMFGNLCRTNGTIDSCNNWQQVDFLSFINIGVKSSELLFNGYKSELNIPLFEALKPFRLNGRYLGTMFNIPHEDEEGKFQQIVLVYQKGTITSSMINNQFPKRCWKKLLSSENN